MGEQGFHLFIKAKINNEKCWLLLDTGPSNSVFDQTEFASHNLKKSKNTKFTAVGVGTDNLDHSIVTLKKLEFGDFVIKKYKTVLLDLTIPNQHYAQLKLPKIHGIIGSDILVEYKAEINFEKKVMLLKK